MRWTKAIIWGAVDNGLGLVVWGFYEGSLLDNFIVTDPGNVFISEEAAPLEINAIIVNEATFKLPVAASAYKIQSHMTLSVVYKS